MDFKPYKTIIICSSETNEYEENTHWQSIKKENAKSTISYTKKPSYISFYTKNRTYLQYAHAIRDYNVITHNKVSIHLNVTPSILMLSLQYVNSQNVHSSIIKNRRLILPNYWESYQ